MKTLKVKIKGEKHIFDVPQNWQEISLKDACDLMYFANGNNSKGTSNFALLAVLLELPLEVIESIQADSFDEHVLDNLTFLNDVKGWEKIVNPDCPDTFAIEDTFFPIKKDIGMCTLGQKEEAIQALFNPEYGTYEKALEILNIYVNNKMWDEGLFRQCIDVLPAYQLLPIANFFLKQLVNTKKFGMIRY